MPSTTNRKTDAVLAAYLIISAILLAGSARSDLAGVVPAGAHLGAAAAIFWMNRVSGPLPRVVVFIRDWYPLCLFPIFFKEVEPLASRLGNWGLTSIVQELENFLFNGQPAEYLSRLLPFVALSELLHLCYFSYLLLLPGLGAYWYVRQRFEAFRQLILLASVTYCVSFILFIFFPVDSPFYLMEPPGPPLSGNFFYELVHFISDRGGARGGAFPSSHVSISTLVLLVAWRFERRVAVVLSPFVVGIHLATVYGRFHYALDVLGGILLAFAVFWLFSSRRHEPLRRPGEMHPSR